MNHNEDLQLPSSNNDELSNIYSHVQAQALANLAVAILSNASSKYPQETKAPGFLLDSETTALVVVDVQPEYWRNCPEVRKDFPDFPLNIARTIRICRERGIKIIWVRVDYRYEVSPWLHQFERLRGIPNAGEIPCESMSVDQLEWEEFARPIANEVVIVKHSFSSTSNTALLDILKASSIRTVLVCGLITSICVHHSAFGIFEAGYHTCIIEDACADRGRQRHDATIQLYGGYMYDIIDSDDLEPGSTGLATSKGNLTRVPRSTLLQRDRCFSHGSDASRTASMPSIFTV